MNLNNIEELLSFDSINLKTPFDEVVTEKRRELTANKTTNLK